MHVRTQAHLPFEHALAQGWFLESWTRSRRSGFDTDQTTNSVSALASTQGRERTVGSSTDFIMQMYAIILNFIFWSLKIFQYIFLPSIGHFAVGFLKMLLCILFKNTFWGRTFLELQETAQKEYETMFRESLAATILGLVWKYGWHTPTAPSRCYYRSSCGGSGGNKDAKVSQPW